MPNTIKTISLTDDDKSYLNKLLTQSTLEIRVYQCARILLLKSEGASNEAIADKLDIGIGVVKRCLNKFKENSVEASLHDNNGRGRKAEITDDDITSSPPAPGCLRRCFLFRCAICIRRRR